MLKEKLIFIKVDDFYFLVIDLVCLDDSFIIMVILENLMLFIYVYV